MAGRSESPRHDRHHGRVGTTLGDLLNGYHLDSGRRRKRVDRTAAPEPAPSPLLPMFRVEPDPDDVDPAADDAPAPAVVRPYAWTKGRTTSQIRFEIETLVSTTVTYSEHDDGTPGEYHSVAALCHQPRSIAEVAALLRIPLGVARVLAGDMAGAGLLAVHETASVDGEGPGIELMERILAGLRSL